jgi:hypothetical protein
MALELCGLWGTWAICGGSYRLAVSDDTTEGDMGDILDAIIAEGSCRACGTRWASVVKMEGDRLVKVRAVAPTKCACSANGESLVPPGQVFPPS